MNNNFIYEFKKECKKNREYLGYSFSDVSVALIDVSEEDYANFEDGNNVLSKENLERLARILCVKKPYDFNVENYIDTTGLTIEEIDDLSSILFEIVGDDNA
jgi:uncharacterized hydantoinase/oxoprolinase family protein